MVDDDLVKANPLAIAGLKLLADSGILRQQQSRLLDQLGSGNPDEKDESLMERVKLFRRTHRALETLQLLGEQLKSEEGAVE